MLHASNIWCSGLCKCLCVCVRYLLFEVCGPAKDHCSLFHSGLSGHMQRMWTPGGTARIISDDPLPLCAIPGIGDSTSSMIEPGIDWYILVPFFQTFRFLRLAWHMGIPKKFSVVFGTVVLFPNYSLFRQLQGRMHFSKIQAHTNTIGWSENSDKLYTMESGTPH